MATQEELLEQISERLGPLTGPDAGSANGLLGLILTYLNNVIDVQLQNYYLTVSVNPPPAGTWTSDTIDPRHCKSVNFQYKIADVGAGTVTIQLQGSLNGTDWINVGSALTGLVDGDGSFSYSNAAGAQWQLMRVVHTNVASSSALTTVQIFGTR